MLHRGDLQALAATTAGGRAVSAGRVDWAQRFRALAASAQDPRLRAYYAHGLPDARTPIREVPLLALDVETTGLDPAQDEIVSIGALPLYGRHIEASAARYWLLRPQGELHAESVTIHSLTHAQLADAPALDSIITELLDCLRGRVLVVHCAAIERRFLDRALRACLGEGIEFPVIDTMALEARLHRRPPGLWRWLSGMLGRRRPQQVSIRLADSRARYRLPRYRAHHALTDALASAELLQAQLAHHYRSDTPLAQLWSS